MFFLCLVNSYGQPEFVSHSLSIKIVACSPAAFNFYYSNHKIELLDNPTDIDRSKSVLLTKDVDDSTALALQSIVDTLAIRGDELVYWNDCIDDGFCFLIFIRKGSSLQKIYVSNYYEKAIAELTAIIDRQFMTYKPYEGLEMGYEPEEINEMIASQNSCNSNPNSEWRREVFDRWRESE